MPASSIRDTPVSHKADVATLIIGYQLISQQLPITSLPAAVGQALLFISFLNPEPVTA
jgi:hypothetical protein